MQWGHLFHLKTETQARELAPLAKSNPVAGGEALQKWTLVFCSQHGTLLDDANVRRKLGRLLEKAGLEPIRYYDLRHTCESLLIAQTAHPPS